MEKGSIYSCNLLFCTWTMDMLCSDRISREFLKRSIWDQTIICDHCIRNHLLLNDRRWIKENFFCYGIVAHAAGITDHPVRQSSWGWGEVFLDTIVVCSVTALSLILTNSYIDYPNVTSAQLTTVAFKVAYGNIGGYFLSLAITVFAWTTIIGMYYSCAKSVNYALGDSNANKIATPIYMVYYMLPCLLFYNIKADLLWTAKILAEQPELIKQVHKDYFKAGADCGITCSYQASIPGLMENGYTLEEAENLIRSAVKIFCEARDEWWEEEGREAGRAWPLCLGAAGPYGAYLADGSEYRGNYGITDEQLKEFHKRRVELLHEAGADNILFETVPSLKEAKVEAEIAEEYGYDY